MSIDDRSAKITNESVERKRMCYDEAILKKTGGHNNEETVQKSHQHALRNTGSFGDPSYVLRSICTEFG